MTAGCYCTVQHGPNQRAHAYMRNLSPFVCSATMLYLLGFISEVHDLSMLSKPIAFVGRLYTIRSVDEI